MYPINMIYNPSKENELTNAKSRFNHFLENNKLFELKEIKDTRTSLQNRALHKFFTMVAFCLDELNLEFTYTGIKGMELSVPYTPIIVKEFFWRPIQITLFGIESTKDLNTKQMNKIIDIITKFFGEKGVFIEFPSIETLKNK